MRHQPDTAFTLDTLRLARRPGAMITFDKTIASPARIGLDLVAIEPGAPLHLDLQLQSVSEGVLVTGTVSAPTVGQCARCLSPITGDVEIDLTEMFAYPDTVTEDSAEDDEIGRVVDDRIELEQAIVDAVGLELPLSPVCSADCPGLCPECGVALATAEEGHGHDLIDPRWAKLAELKLADPKKDSR